MARTRSRRRPFTRISAHETQRSVGGMASGIPKVVTRYALLNATMPCKRKIIGGICSVWRTHQKPDERSGNRRHCKVDEGAHIQDDQINNVGHKKRNAFALRLHSHAAPPPPLPRVGAAAEKPNAVGVSFFVCFNMFWASSHHCSTSAPLSPNQVSVTRCVVWTTLGVWESGTSPFQTFFKV